jgi:tripartite-type tricarboxylate transporter receptor subunit TctC
MLRFNLPFRTDFRAFFGSVIVAVAVMLLVLFGYSVASKPTRSIKVVIPFPASGAADVVARILADEVSRTQGVSIVIENHPGAGSVLGTEVVARAPPDGNTLLINANSFVIGPSLRKLTYDPLASFDPICHLGVTPIFIVVGATSPYRTLGELFDEARLKPGTLTLASLGPATAQHLAFELLKRRAKVELTLVPFPGNVPAITALLGGHVTSSFANYPDVIEHIRAGKLRALATTTRTRVESLPEVPTVAELGFDNYEAEVWLGLVAPAKTPRDRISQIASWFTAAMDARGIRERLAVQGVFAKTMCGAPFGAYLRAQRDEYARIIRESNIQGE